MGIIVAVVTGTSVSLVPWGMWMTLLHTLDPGTVSGGVPPARGTPRQLQDAGWRDPGGSGTEIS